LGALGVSVVLTIVALQAAAAGRVTAVLAALPCLGLAVYAAF
jgi:heme/copper-type cytochrome/quinol oxidase subunit 4